MTREACLDGATLSYLDTGNGLPLVCLHGGMGIDSASLRVPGILNLSDRGVRLIIPDQRGHGVSSRHAPSDYTHATWAADVRALATQLGLQRLALLGHSYGGFLALEYAVRWPESLTHLILIATSAGPVVAPRDPLKTDEDLGKRFRDVWPHFFSGEDKQWSFFDTLRFSVGPYNAAFARELPRYDVRDRVRGLNLPMLLVVGANDHYVPNMQWLAHNVPNATLCVMEGVGHFPFVEAPDQFVATVTAFLKPDFNVRASQ